MKNKLLTIVEALEQYKGQKKDAVSDINDAEREIITLLGTPSEGSESHEVGPFKVTIKKNQDELLVAEEWEKIKDSIPPMFRPVDSTVTIDLDNWEEIKKHIPSSLLDSLNIEFSQILNKKGMKYLKEKEPDTYLKILPAIETKDKKTTVTLKRTK